MQYDVAQQLAAFVPRALLTDPLPVGEVRCSEGASLFADLSGFTSLTETLAQMGDRGVELLGQTLRSVFTPLIDAIHTHNGTISHFYGDAMLVYFIGDGTTTVPQAFRCATALQAAITSFHNLSIENHQFQLSLKCGIGFGTLRRLVIAAASQREFVLTGSSVEEATAAEKKGDHPIELGSVAITYLDRKPRTPFQRGELPSKLPAWVPEFVPPAIVERLSNKGRGAQLLAEHRPITSIFVRFEGLDDEDSAFGRKLSDYYQHVVTLVNRYAKENGRVNRILTGDKGNQLHIILGAPTAPHAPAQALRLARAIQHKKPADITSQQIGMVSGRAFAVPLGSDSRHEYTVIGKIVNLSARLCGICPANEIFCDATTAQITDQFLQFEQQHEIVLKGIAQPIVPMRLVGIKVNPAQLEARYGESFDKPLNIHRDAFAELDAALRGKTRYVALVGEAGIGKSRVVAAVAEQWLAQGFVGFVGACAPESTEIPYTPWAAILRALIDLPPTTSPEKQIARLRALYSSLPANEATARLIADLPLMIEALGWFDQLPDELAKLDAKTKQARLFALIRDSLQFFTRIQPHLLVFEDIHDADRASLDLIDYLVDAPNLRLSILVTTREKPERDPTTVLLKRLVPTETVAYVHELLSLDAQPLPDSLITYFTRAGSYTVSATPLFLEEAVRAMWAHGVLRRVDGLLAVDETRLAQLALPNNVHALLLARIDKLAHIYRSTLNVGAVIGTEFSADILKQVAPFAESTIDRALQRLEREDFIRPIGNKTYLFQHGMTRSAAYETLSFEERKRLHADVALALETQFAGRERAISAELARHHAFADHHQKAVQFGKIAAQDAFELYANREVLQLSDLCLKHLKDEPILETEILLLKAQVQLRLGDFEGAAKSADKAIQLATPVAPDLAYEGYTRLSAIAFQQGDHAQALTHASNLITHLEKQLPDKKQAFVIAYSLMSRSLSALHLYEEALGYLHKAEQLCEKLGDDRRLSSVQASIAFCYYSQHKLDIALKAMERCIQIARSSVRDTELVSHLNNLALLHSKLGHYRMANRIIDEALPLAQFASERRYASTLSRRGSLLACLGDFSASESAFLSAIHLLVNMKDPDRLIEIYLLMADELYCNVGDLEKSADVLTKAHNLMAKRATTDNEQFLRWQLTRGRIALALQKHDDAVSLFQRASTLISYGSNFRWRPALALYEGQLANTINARETAERKFKAGIAAATQSNGNREFLGMLLIENALLVADVEMRDKQLNAALHQLKSHSRYAHRDAARQLIGKLIEQGQSIISHDHLNNVMEM